jgi:hypothetical protein
MPPVFSWAIGWVLMIVSILVLQSIEPTFPDEAVRAALREHLPTAKIVWCLLGLAGAVAATSERFHARRGLRPPGRG